MYKRQVYQNAYAQAEAFIEMCKQVRDGVDPATIEDINVPFEPITVANLADYYTAESSGHHVCLDATGGIQG